MSDKNRIWNAANREKHLAHREVEYAVKYGRLISQPCTRCGTNDGVHAHHEDYAKPLVVIWFCPTHHLERHVEIKLGVPLRPNDIVVAAPAGPRSARPKMMANISWSEKEQRWVVKFQTKELHYRKSFKELDAAIADRDAVLQTRARQAEAA